MVYNKRRHKIVNKYQTICRNIAVNNLTNYIRNEKMCDLSQQKASDGVNYAHAEIELHDIRGARP